MADLTVTGYGDEYADNGITCCKLDTFGRTITLMYWADYSEAGDTWYGWYNADWDVEYKDVTLAPGEGVWFKSPNANYKLVSSGEVLNETLPVTLIAGSQLCPNATPVTLKMSQVWMAGYGDEYADNGITCCKLDTFGRTITLMYWADYSEAGDTWYGWYNADWDVEYKNEELAPGESVWLKSPTAGWTVNWPSPLTNN